MDANPINSPFVTRNDHRNKVVRYLVKLNVLKYLSWQIQLHSLVSIVTAYIQSTCYL